MKMFYCEKIDVIYCIYEEKEFEVETLEDVINVAKESGLNEDEFSLKFYTDGSIELLPY
jgi:hypothetical protein